MIQDPDKVRAKRESVFRSGRITFGSGRQLSCRVRNISATGACVDHKGDLRQGMSFRIAIGKEPDVDARVMWVSEKLAGIAFGAAPADDDPAAPSGPTAGWMAEQADAYKR